MCAGCHVGGAEGIAVVAGGRILVLGQTAEKVAAEGIAAHAACHVVVAEGTAQFATGSVEEAECLGRPSVCVVVVAAGEREFGSIRLAGTVGHPHEATFIRCESWQLHCG